MAQSENLENLLSSLCEAAINDYRADECSESYTKAYEAVENYFESLRARVAGLEASSRWIPVGERLPETPESNNGYSLDWYLLAYKVEGGDYHGLLAVSSYHVTDGWSYRGEYDGLKKWGYEPVAWRELPESYEPEPAQP
jgi:hypothetical protein